MKYKYTKNKGFTLLEVLIVIGIIAVLSAAVLVAVNPTRQFKLARDSQRVANVSAIANAVSQSMSENKGIFPCEGELVGGQDTNISSTDADIAGCLVPDFISSIPFDPSVSGAKYTDNTDYDSGYKIGRDPATNRIVISATGEIDQDIKATR